MIWTIITIIVWIIAVASVISAIAPYTINTKDDTFAGKAQKVIDFLALNLKKK